jgi:hypothetical protein
MKTILIPTDYNVSTFNCIHALCNQLNNEDINIIFVHMFKLSDSVTDLLMLSRRSREYEKVSDAFYAGTVKIKEEYPAIQNIRIEFLYGGTLGMFKDFLELNDVDMILETKSCSFSKIHKSSIDPAVLVQRSGLPVLKLNKTAARVNQQVSAPVYHDELLTEV